MKKIYVLYKITYGDFDMPIRDAIAVSFDFPTLLAAKDELMARRTKEEIDSCVSYEIPRTAIRFV